MELLEHQLLLMAQGKTRHSLYTHLAIVCRVLDTQRELDPIPSYRDPMSRVGGWEDEGSWGGNKSQVQRLGKES